MITTRLLKRMMVQPTLRQTSRRLLSSATNTPDTSQPARTPQAFVSEPLRFQGSTELTGSAEDRMKHVFGARLEGGSRLSSSRRDVGEPRLIAGILVPDKPKEPDNCCMSGCVNCVWEQYNDDIRDWRRQRKEAALALNKTEGIWPADFHPPLKVLDFKNVPKELRSTKRKMSKGASKISSSAYFPVKGKPGAQNLKKNEEQDEEINDAMEDDAWANIPPAFKAFAEHEKRLKEKKLKRKLELEAQKTGSTSASTAA